MNTKKYYSLLLSLSFLYLGAASGRGQTPYTSTLEVLLSEYAYHEPSMKNVGPMTGIGFSFAKWSGQVYWDTDMAIEFGRVKYTSVDTGSLNNDSNFMAEMRITAGMNMVDQLIGGGSQWSVMPYGGVAYRFLRNDTAGQTTDTGYNGYDRKSNYFYSPLGVAVTRHVGPKWTVTTKGEYDLFWLGTQFTYIQDTTIGHTTYTNHQSSGWGLRGSVEIRYQGKKRDFIVEPYISFWNIGKSNSNYLPVFGDPDNPNTPTSWEEEYEPKNTTTEIGCKLGFSF